MFEKILKRQIYHLANIIFIIIWIIYFIALFTQPFLGLTMEKNGQSWIVTQADSYAEGYRLGVRVGDIIISIDNKEPGIHPSVQSWRDVEGASVLLVKSPGQPARTIQVSQVSLLSTLFSEVPLAFLGMSFWIVGLVTWFKRPFLVQARALFWLNLFIGLSASLASASGRQLMWGRELEILCFSFVPPLLVNFVAVFPVERKNRAITLALNGFMAVSVSVAILLGLKSLGLIFITSELTKLVLTEAVLSSLIAIGYLGSLTSLPAIKPERNQVIIVFTGLAIGLLPFILFTALPILLYGSAIVNTKITAIFTITFPMACSYVIVKKYLPDGRQLLEMLITYMFAGLLAAGGIAYLLLMTGLVKEVNYQNNVMLFTQIIAGLILFSFSKSIIQRMLDKVTFISHREFRKTVDKLNERVALIRDDLVLEGIVEELELERAFVFAEDGQGGYLRKASGRYLQNPGQQELLESFYFSAKPHTATILSEDLPAEVYIPFRLDNFLGGIFLGHRCSHVKFKPEEISRLTLLCYQVAQRLQNTHMIDLLSQRINEMSEEILNTQRKTQGLGIINRLLFANFEEERKAVAREIHDGPLQLGLEASRRLKQLLAESPGNEKVSGSLFLIQDLVDDLNYELREICTDLRPSSLSDLGLIPAVEFMCQDIMKKELLIISLKIEGINREQRFKEDIELSAFRFLKEGLANVVKHSGVSQTEVNISLSNGNLELSVKDSGRGFDINKLHDWVHTGNHFGIIGMRERIESLGGDFVIEAKTCHGVSLKASIPINN
ncbi:MAG: histidine kinase [Clostridia bacterium]|nr:histidine kinase [Clostridia bacterium]